MRRYLSHFSRREATIWPQGRIEPQQKVFTVPSISAGGGLYNIHPMRRGGVKSFVDDLVLGRGVVISRAATSLRSVETQPLTRRFVRNKTNNISVLVRGSQSFRGTLALSGYGPRPVGSGAARPEPAEQQLLLNRSAGSNPAPGY